MKGPGRLVTLALLGVACSQGGAGPAAIGDAGHDDAGFMDADAGFIDADAGFIDATDVPRDSAGADVATADDSAGVVDADSPPVSCDPSAPFRAPVPLAGDQLNTTHEEGGPRLTADELTLYFSSRRLYPNTGNASGIFVAHRSSPTAAFDAPVALTALDPPGGQGDFEPTTVTDLELFFAWDQGGALPFKDIWVAKRASVSNDFGPPTDLPSPLNSPSEDATPFLTADGSELWFSSGRGGPGGQDLYRAVRTGSSFAAPELVTAVSSTANDWSPTLSADGLVIYFSSDRTDGAVLGVEDIWTASRAHVTDPFSNVHPVPEVNSPQRDFAGWLSRDKCRLYFSSTRPGGAGSEDIYVATRGG